MYASMHACMCVCLWIHLHVAYYNTASKKKVPCIPCMAACIGLIENVCFKKFENVSLEELSAMLREERKKDKMLTTESIISVRSPCDSLLHKMALQFETIL